MPALTSSKLQPFSSLEAAQIAHMPEATEMFFVSKTKISMSSCCDAARRIVLNVPERPLEMQTAITFS